MNQSTACPSCGAEIPTVAIKCEFCGLEIKATNTEGVDLIKNLQEKLTEVENSFSTKDIALRGEMAIWKAKADVINSFTLPTTKKDLIDLLLIANSNIQGSSGGVNLYGNPVKKAWQGKAQQAYSMLKIYGQGDPLVENMLLEYAYLSTSNAQQKKGWFKNLFS